MSRMGTAGHGTFRVEQISLVRSQTELDQGARIGNRLRLPTIGGLKFLHGGLGRCVPIPGRLPTQVVLANQGFLDLPRALGIDFLLAALARYISLSRLLALAMSRFPGGRKVMRRAFCRGFVHRGCGGARARRQYTREQHDGQSYRRLSDFSTDQGPPLLKETGTLTMMRDCALTLPAPKAC